MITNYYNISRRSHSSSPSFLEDIFSGGGYALCLLNHGSSIINNIIHSTSFLEAFSKIASKKEIEVLKDFKNDNNDFNCLFNSFQYVYNLEMGQYETDVENLFYFIRVSLEDQKPICNAVQAIIYSEEHAKNVEDLLKRRRQMTKAAQSRIEEIKDNLQKYKLSSNKRKQYYLIKKDIKISHPFLYLLDEFLFKIYKTFHKLSQSFKQKKVYEELKLFALRDPLQNKPVGFTSLSLRDLDKEEYNILWNDKKRKE